MCFRTKYIVHTCTCTCTQYINLHVYILFIYVYSIQHTRLLSSMWIFFLYIQFRDRASTDPWPVRPSGFGTAPPPPSSDMVGAGGTAPHGTSPHQPHYMKQISTPEMSHPSTMASSPSVHSHTHPLQPVPTSFGGPPVNDFQHQAARQLSEYGSFQTELSVSAESVLREQSERYAHFESEAMKRKGPTRK